MCALLLNYKYGKNRLVVTYADRGKYQYNIYIYIYIYMIDNVYDCAIIVRRWQCGY